MSASSQVKGDEEKQARYPLLIAIKKVLYFNLLFKLTKHQMLTV